MRICGREVAGGGFDARCVWLRPGSVMYPGFLQKFWFSDENAGRLRAHIRNVRALPPPQAIVVVMAHDEMKM